MHASVNDVTIDIINENQYLCKECHTVYSKPDIESKENQEN